MTECICEGNWRQIIKESEPLFNKMYRDKFGVCYRFRGIMHGNEDYYYVFTSSEGDYQLLSCVGSIENFGYELIGE